MAHADLPPALPTEDRGAVEEHDAPHLGLAAGVEPGVGAGDERRERIVGRRDDGVDQSAGEVDLDGLDHRGEQVGLVGELVVEGAARDTGGVGDALGADLRVPVLGEQRPGGGDQRGTGGGGPIGLATPSHDHVDIRAAGM